MITGAWSTCESETKLKRAQERAREPAAPGPRREPGREPAAPGPRREAQAGKETPEGKVQQALG